MDSRSGTALLTENGTAPLPVPPPALAIAESVAVFVGASEDDAAADLPASLRSIPSAAMLTLAHAVSPEGATSPTASPRPISPANAAQLRTESVF